MNQMWRNLYACRESDRGDAQPEQFSSEKQNDDANQHSNNRDGGMHRRKSGLYGHMVEALWQTPVYLISVLDTSAATPCSDRLGSISLLSAATYAR